jgi:hypothetical protein
VHLEHTVPIEMAGSGAGLLLLLLLGAVRDVPKP